MNRSVVLLVGFTLGCSPGPIALDTGEAPSESESSTSTDSTDSSSTDTGTDTDEPLPPPTNTCEASVFAIDDTYDYSGPGPGAVPTVVRDDGVIVAVHPIGLDYSLDYRVRAWDVDGTELWSELFGGVDESSSDTALAVDQAGDVYLGHGVWSPGVPAGITKFFGVDGGESWSFEAGGMGAWNQSVADMHFDAAGQLLAAMTLNVASADSDFVVEALDPQSGMALGWHAQWDGPDNDSGYSYDSLAGLAVDHDSGRVFGAGNDSDGMVVIAWDPPSTRPSWVVRPFEGDSNGWVEGLELTTTGKLVVLEQHRTHRQYWTMAPRIVVLDPDDGDLTWLADWLDLGFDQDDVTPVDMVAMPDGGVAVSGYIPGGTLAAVDGFLLRLDGDFLLHCLDITGFPEPHVLMELDVSPSGQIYAGGWFRVSSDILIGSHDYRPLVVRWD